MANGATASPSDARARSLPTSLPSSNEGGLRCVGRCRCYRCGGRDGARAMTRAASPSSKPNLSYMPCHLPALSPSLPSAFARSFTLSLSLQHILLGKWPQSPFPFSPRSIFAEGGGGGGDGCLPLGFSSPFALPLPALVVVRCCSKGRSLRLGEVRSAWRWMRGGGALRFRSAQQLVVVQDQVRAHVIESDSFGQVLEGD